MNRLRLPASRWSLTLLLIVTLGLTSSFAQTAATASDGWVVLPVSEYTALKQAAYPGEPEPAAPHHEQLVDVMVMPGEFALDLHRLQFLAVELDQGLGPPMLGEGGEFIGNVDPLGHWPATPSMMNRAPSDVLVRSGTIP